MYSFFKRERLLLTLLVLFGLFFGILGAVLKYAAPQEDKSAPAIAYGFRALHDSAAKKAKSQSQAQANAPEADPDAAPAQEPAPAPEDDSPFRTVDESYFSDALFPAAVRPLRRRGLFLQHGNDPDRLHGREDPRGRPG